MRILLTNDDGVHAEGLKVLERIARQLTDDVWVCAPENEQSGAGRSLTLSAPLRARRISDKHFAVSGTPTDCVMLAINDLMDAKPDLVLSGVNRGHNIGEDVSMSGTVAGAIQAMAMGVPGIALSQAFRARERAVSEADMYKSADAFGAGIVQRLVQIGWPSDVVMNVNFPADPDGVEAVEVTRQGFRDAAVMTAEKRTDLRGRDYYWMGFRQHKSEPPQGTDLRAIYDGRISVTPLHIDLTHMETVHAMKGVLGGVPPKLADHSKPVEGP